MVVHIFNPIIQEAEASRQIDLWECGGQPCLYIQVPGQSGYTVTPSLSPPVREDPLPNKQTNKQQMAGYGSTSLYPSTQEVDLCQPSSTIVSSRSARLLSETLSQTNNNKKNQTEPNKQKPR